MKTITLKSTEAGKSFLIKHRLLFLLLLVLSFFIFNFYIPETEKQLHLQSSPVTYLNNNIYDKFILGAMDEETGAWINGYSTTDQLELNVSHAYTDGYWDNSGGFPRRYPKGRTPNDLTLASINSYKDEVTDYLQNIYDNHNGRRSITTRPKIQWLGYGQSSVYQAESLTMNHDTWFYCYNRDADSVGREIPDQGRTVIFCRTSNSTNQGNWVDNPGFVCKRLRANTEQSCPEKNFNGDVDCDWFVKPCIRIPVGIPDETEICTLFVKQYFNLTVTDKITPVILKAKHFHQFGQQYNGGYNEEFYFNQIPGEIPQGIKFHGSLGNKFWFNARGTTTVEDLDTNVNKADIQVKWTGNCDMWIDYVKVENDIADELLNPNNPLYLTRQQWIKDEVEKIAFNESPSSVPLMLKFYIELTEFNNLPCMAYINQKLKEYSLSYSGGNYSVDLMADFTHTNFCHVRYLENFTKIGTSKWIYDNYIDKVGLTQFFAEAYPLTSSFDYGDIWSKIPNTLPNLSGQYVLAEPVNPAEYDTWLQDELNSFPYSFESNYHVENKCPVNSCDRSPCEDKGNYRFIMKIGNEISRNYNIPFIFMPQAHLWYWPGEIRREPTNEELSMMANVGVSYGARGLQWFWFWSLNGVAQCIYDPLARGMVDYYGNLLTDNQYGQGTTYPKWQVFRDVSRRMKKWETIILNSDYSSNYSFIYNTEHETFKTETYFTDIVTYKPGSAPPPCVNDMPGDSLSDNIPLNYIYECNEDRYLQAAVFENTNEENTNYFMIVNRRCSPLQPDHNDGERYIRVKFDNNHTELAVYDNWKITDVANPDWSVTFNKHSLFYTDLGFFSPGEGRLYKMTSVMKSGGILAGDEDLSGVSFTCEDTVFNNGYNITIGANTTIHFTDTSNIVMNGGVFTMGNPLVSGLQNITSDAVPGNVWHGNSFNGCEVKIYGANFTGLANDTTYAVNIIDCPAVDIRNSSFTSNNTLKGGINAVYYSTSSINNIYIGGNSFNSTGSTLPVINVSGYAGITTPIIIENNTITEANTGILLSGITGGAVKGNYITNCYIGINLLSSNADLYNNTVTSDLAGSTGLLAVSGSELRLSPAGGSWYGGLNNISNTGEDGINIKTTGGFFYMDEGENIFNINDAESFHLNGYFPSGSQLFLTPDATVNCFKFEGNPVNPYEYVTFGEAGSQVMFTFSPFLSGCEQDGGEGMTVLNMGGGIYDTISTEGSGSGGSNSSAFPITKMLLTRTDISKLYKDVESVPRTDINQEVLFTSSAAKEKYDSICVLMRYRNYSSAKTKCLEMLNQYPDSIQSLSAIPKLFLSSAAVDTSVTGANELKIYLEGLILNNQNNTGLVKRANYYI